jgi:cytochrome P450
LEDLKANPSLAKAFVEELCRFHTASAMATRRVAKVDIMLGGKVGLYRLFDPSPLELIYPFLLAY